MVAVEVCIDCDGRQAVTEAVAAAFDGGAATVELCGAMHCDGLTPQKEQIAAARKAFAARRGLMVMIRPRAGGFSYTQGELATMRQQIAMAAAEGADGVVFGVLQADSGRIDVPALHELAEISTELNLRTTFHRAFDVLADPIESMPLLIRAGIDRVLTSGVRWGQNKTALDGIEQLCQTIRAAAGRIEIVVGGGLSGSNVQPILKQLPLQHNTVSLHAHTGAKQDGITTLTAVRSLVSAAQQV